MEDFVVIQLLVAIDDIPDDQDGELFIIYEKGIIFIEMRENPVLAILIKQIDVMGGLQGIAQPDDVRMVDGFGHEYFIADIGN
jgi:hypothetical protein